jgi:hypothetical protein
VEGAVFYLFGMRDKSSWIGFVILNLITHGLLSGFLVHPFEAKGDFFMLIFTASRSFGGSRDLLLHI